MATETIKVLTGHMPILFANSWNPDQVQRDIMQYPIFIKTVSSVGSDLGPIYLQIVSADDHFHNAFIPCFIF